MTDPSSVEKVPDRFGIYKVVELLGTGGMGRVYRALDEALDREVALKTLLPALAADSDFVARFTREARSAAALNHPNITQVYATGLEGTIPYFAMELIRGQSLEALVKGRGALDPAIAAGYMVQAAAGLRHAALKGLIHRDVKPSNLMLTEDGVLKVTDFGLAKAASADTRLTATGEVLGSPGYIPPEQAQGMPIDLRSDIYSLGATFYHLVTGHLPFEAPTAVAMIMKHMNEPVRSPRALNASIPFPIAAVIQKMMAKRPGERFQDYDSLIRELERAAGEAQPSTMTAGDPTSVTQRRPAAVRSAAPPASAVRNGLRPGFAGRAAEAAADFEAVPVEQGRSLPILPAGLMIAVLGLVVLGAWQKFHSSGLEEGTARAATVAAPTIESDGTFTSHATASRGSAGGTALGDRLSDARGAESRANLIFLSNDHDTLSNGKMRVKGEVRNTGGGPAQQARVRVRLTLANGTVAAQGETALKPAIIPAGQSAVFELDLDYDGPIGTIKAELIWSD
jgi:hypothetical protein